MDMSEVHRQHFNIFWPSSDVQWSYLLANETSAGWMQFKLYLHDELVTQDGCLWEFGHYMLRKSPLTWKCRPKNEASNEAKLHSALQQ